MQPGVLLALDALSAVLTLLVALFFFRLWHASADPKHGLISLGFLVIGGTFPFSAISNLQLAATLDGVDAARLSGQLGGALVIALAYASARVHGESRPLIVLALAILAALAVYAVVIAIPPVGSLRGLFPAAHATMVLAYGTCAAFSLASVLRRPEATSFLVPGAFLSWALSKYTWLLHDFAPDDAIVPFVYVWRFSAIVLLLVAVALPARRRPLAAA